MADPAPAIEPPAVEGDFLAACAREVDGFLDRTLPPVTGAAATLAAAMRYAVLGGGKRIRPAIAMASAIAVGGRSRDALPVAGALEMVHTYSLIHDDLPCMDNDDLRRGRPTVHVRFSEDIAVLAGDALHTLAFTTIAGAGAPPEIRLECVRRLGVAAGPEGMVAGQVLDMESEGRIPDAEQLEAIHRAKTGALISVSAALGALAGGGSIRQADALAVFGGELGLLFQIVDDLLDAEQTSARLGKTAGKDRAAGKATYLAVHGIEAARAEATRRAGLARGLLDDVEAVSGRPLDPTGVRLLRRLTERIRHRNT